MGFSVSHNGTVSLQKWQVRNTNNQLWSPMTEKELIENIARGEINGDESVREYPGGDWNPIVRHKIFSNALLSYLEGELHPNEAYGGPRAGEEDHSPKFIEETVIIPFKKVEAEELKQESSFQEETNNQKKVYTKSENKNLSNLENRPVSFLPIPKFDPAKQLIPKPIKAPLALPSASSPKAFFVENSLEENAEVRRKSSDRSIWILSLALSLGFFAMAAYLDIGGVGTYLGLGETVRPQFSGDYVRLLEPVKSKMQEAQNIGAAEIQKQMDIASALYFESTVEAYQASQAKLISLLEAKPDFLEARKLLCLVHHELWPFSAQTYADEQAMTAVARKTRSLDLMSTAGIICESLMLQAKGQAKAALGLVDYSLSALSSGSSDLFLVFTKSEILKSLGNEKDAELYYRSVLNDYLNLTQKTWINPALSVVEINRKQGRINESFDLLKSVQKERPGHKVSLLWQGLMIFEDLQQMEPAEAALQRGLGLSGRVPPRLLADANFALARIRKVQGDKLEARKLAEAAYRLNPNLLPAKRMLEDLGATEKELRGKSNVKELFALGDAYMQQGDYLSAQAQYKAIYTIDKNQTMAAIKAAKALWALYQPLEAIEWAQKAMAADSKSITAHALCAEYMAQRYDFVNAFEVLKKLSKRVSMNFELYKAFGQLEFIKNDLKRSIEYLDKAYSLYPNDTETLLLLAKAHLGLRDPKETQLSERFVNEALSLDPSNIKTHQVYILVKSQLYGASAAELYVKKILEQYPESVDIKEVHAEILVNDERCVMALPVYESLIKEAKASGQKPRPKWYILQGDCYFKTGNSNSALQSYLSAVVISPSDAEPLIKAGLLYMDLERFQDAITQFKRAAQSNKLHPRVHLFLARAYLAKGDADSSIKALAEERKYNPSLTDVYVMEGEIYTKNRDWKKCADSLQEAVKRYPYGADIYVRLARCYRQAESLDIAKQMLFIAQKKESGYADIYKELGQLLETEGDISAAMESYNKYLSLSPNAPDREQVESRLKSTNR